MKGIHFKGALENILNFLFGWISFPTLKATDDLQIQNKNTNRKKMESD